MEELLSYNVSKMAIPDYQTFMLPLLKQLVDGQPHHISEVSIKLADELGLTAEERAQVLPSGTQTVYRSRIGWARTYLSKAGLIESTARGQWQITEEGKRVVVSNIDKIDNQFLTQYESFRRFRQRSEEATPDAAYPAAESTATLTPEEQMNGLHQQLNAELALEILDQLKRMHPALFERVVIDVLVAMGYGGSLQDAGQAVGRTGDGGIDGIIKQDRLGLENVYVQAKRWQGSVGSEVVRTFAGSLQVQGANKGVLITTSEFTESARSTAKLLVTSRVILVDGMTFARLMIEHNVGVGIAAKYEVKKIDKDYFEDE